MDNGLRMIEDRRLFLCAHDFASRGSLIGVVLQETQMTQVT